MEEYKMLRAEIMYFMNKDTTLFTYLFTGVTAVLFFAIKEKIPECCILSFLIIIPICSKFAYHQKQMAKISAYMVQHLEKEEKLNIKWETNLNKLSDIKNDMLQNHENGLLVGNKKSFSIIKFGKFLECPMMACATLASYAYLIYIKCPDLEKDAVFWAITILIIILFFVTLKLCRSIYKINDFRKEYHILWEEFEKKQMQENKS